jgi:hypothetical protein
MCSDAFQYIWTKRQFIGEMARLIDHGGEPGAVLISHTHNERQWSPSHGQPLAPEGYRDLFETLTPRILGETALLADVVKGGPLDLSRNEPAETLDREPALTIVATSRADVLTPHPLTTSQASIGELRLNPLYAVAADGDRLQLRLRFPSQDYEDEYSACRQYLSETATVDRRTVDAMNHAQQPADLADLIRRRIVLDLPKRYY